MSPGCLAAVCVCACACAAEVRVRVCVGVRVQLISFGGRLDVVEKPCTAVGSGRGAGRVSVIGGVMSRHDAPRTPIRDAENLEFR
jgi:hypothetical protein